MTGLMSMRVADLAVRDLKHEMRLTLVTVLSATVALAPLIILFALKVGLVDTMRAGLASDPANLELTMRGGGDPKFDEAWFENMEQRPETGFVVPLTRGTVARAVLRNLDDDTSLPFEVPLIPSAIGDILLERNGLVPPSDLQVVLTTRVAEILKTSVGDKLQIVIGRTDGPRREVEELELVVTGVLPLSASRGQRAYVALDLLTAIEDYREWQRVDQFGWTGRAPTDDAFADFRLYARDIDNVEPLRKLLLGQNIETDSAANRIQVIRSIDQNLGLIFQVLLILILFGFATALALNQLASVARKSGHIAVLRLLGYGGRELMLFPIIQSAVIALAGALLALLVFAMSSQALAAILGDLIDDDTAVTHLPYTYYIVIPLGSVFIAVIASTFAAYQILKISPAKEMRHA